MTEIQEEITEDKEVAASDRRSWDDEELARTIAMWESGNFTLGQIAKEIGRQESTISRKMKASGIVKGARKTKIQEQVSKAIEEDIVSRSEELARKFAKINDDCGTHAELLQTMLMQEAAAARRDNEPYNKRKGNVDTLVKMLDGISKAQEIRTTALGTPVDKIISEETLTSIGIVAMDEKEVAEVKREASIRAGHAPKDLLEEESPPSDAPEPAQQLGTVEDDS